MEWQTVQRRGRGRTSDPVQALAEQLRAVLRPKPNQGKARTRLPDWHCPQCATSNWQTRATCRQCGRGWDDSIGRVPLQVTPQPPRPWPVARPVRAGGRADLNSVAQAAAEAGASTEAVEALRQDAALRREERRTAGGKLDAARAKAARTARQVEEAREAMARASAKVADAEHAAKEAAAELAEVEATLTSPSPAKTPSTVLDHVRVLLTALERAPIPGVLGTGPALPESVLTAIAA